MMPTAPAERVFLVPAVPARFETIVNAPRAKDKYLVSAHAQPISIVPEIVATLPGALVRLAVRRAAREEMNAVQSRVLMVAAKSVRTVRRLRD